MSRRSKREIFFATCAPGLEPVLFAEARELKLPRLEQQYGGVYFEGTIEDAWRANLHLHMAIRVLLRVARYPANDSDALYEGASLVPWERFVRPDGTLAVTVRGARSAFDNTMFVAQRVKDAIVDRFRAEHGIRPSVDKDAPDLLVNVHLRGERVTLSVDTSGESLHKRGWRVYGGRAPLSEVLAAAVLRFAGWDRRSPIVDPFCGSGVLLIEAALWAAGSPAGAFRKSFGFERFPGHDADRWKAYRAAEIAAARPVKKLILRGSDTDGKTLDGARANAESAGVLDQIEFRRADARSIEWTRGWNAWIIANLPYGERMGDRRKMATIFREFGARLRSEASGYTASFLGNEDDLQLIGLPKPRLVKLRNGPIEVALATARLP